MPNLLNSFQERLSTSPKIFAYGLDAAGFDVHNRTLLLDDKSNLEFVDFSDPRSFDAADGVIVPQGIFEEFKKIEPNYLLFSSKTQVWVHKASLLERERQILNLLRNGKWVCFLVGAIVDNVYQGIHSEPVRDTDLCKRILNSFHVGRNRPFNLNPPAPVRSQIREFQSYVSVYGKPRTVFELPHDYPIEREVIVELGDRVAGFEFDHQLFFLPFSVVRKDWNTAASLVNAAASAISRYRASRLVAIPAWVDEIRFRTEESLYLEINASLEKVNRLESELASWRDFKAILTTSGEPLNDRVIEILEAFFEFQVERPSHDQPNTLISADFKKPIAVLETASLEKDSIKELVKKLDSHRKGFSLPGLLVINNEAEATNIFCKMRGNIPGDVAKYARELNIFVARTIDLLFLMHHVEKVSQRKKLLIEILSSEGGWIKADTETYELIS